MTIDRTERTGFAPHAGERVRGRHGNILVQLIATVALVMSTAVAGTVVTIGIARADEVGAAAVASVHFAIVSGCVLAGVGALVAVISRKFDRVLPS
jgi:hypothetical protein